MMIYAIRYKTIVCGSECAVTIRKISEEGFFWGDVVVYDNRFIFDIVDTFDTLSTKILFESILFLTETFQEMEGNADCWIAESVQARNLLFRHIIDYVYDVRILEYYERFILTLDEKIKPMICKKIIENQQQCKTLD